MNRHLDAPASLTHALEVKHHFGCCRQTVAFPLDRYAELVELVAHHQHVCPHASEDELPVRKRAHKRSSWHPQPMTQRAKPGDTPVSPDGLE